MSAEADANVERPASPRRGLPLRDLFLLPLLSAATLAVMLGGAELASRALYPEHEADTCYVADKDGGHHIRGSCTSRTKVPEGAWATNAYNACGYRTPEPCGPTPAGTRRVAVVGSSTAAGYLTPFDETFAARSAKALRQACGRPVEFQNLGAAGYVGPRLLPRVREAMGLAPESLVMLLTEVDMDLADIERNAAAGAPPPGRPSLAARVKEAIGSSRAMYMMQYFLLRSDASYLPFYLQVTSTAGFLQTPLPPLWQARLAHLDAELAEAAATANGKPFTVIFAPQRAAAAMRASGRDWPGFSHEVLPQAIGRIAARHGLTFIDGTKAFHKGMAVNQYYYTVNGHINGEGHRLLSELYLKQVTGPGGPFADCARAAAN